MTGEKSGGDFENVVQLRPWLDRKSAGGERSTSTPTYALTLGLNCQIAMVAMYGYLIHRLLTQHTGSANLLSTQRKRRANARSGGQRLSSFLRRLWLRLGNWLRGVRGLSNVTVLRGKCHMSRSNPTS